MSLLAGIFVLLGGFLGGTARFYVSGAIGQRFGETFPWGTLTVNICGSFLIGVLAGLGRNAGGVYADPLFHDFLLTGFCGGFTTVSSFALQTLNLGIDGERVPAVLNIAGSAIFCLIAVAAGMGAVMAATG